ncbi:hypothetical protein BJY04DRAFT_217951 [Aspergillus karnatakaensis]|uniref:uncharacterized protein n=1 Tax=Aspergillus karnatakaensis TaxID=1810916 RepID=UPI003CCD9402
MKRRVDPLLLWLLIWSPFAGVSASGLDDFSSNLASDLDDFSSNLASDLGPLLALFGEKITIQYFSESTTFVDYLIFALAPLGIVTAITSAIRVCGDASLRAFIGRAQEGDGTIEAELCTSTSRDVCELFHRGGITRVFGKPNILEVVHIRGPEEARKPDNGRHVMGIYLFRDYLTRERNNSTAAWVPKKVHRWIPITIRRWLRRQWHRVKDVVTRHNRERKQANKAEKSDVFRTEDTLLETGIPPGSVQPHSLAATRNPPEVIVHNPNISINVGIAMLPTWLFWCVACLGFILQSGVIVMAATVSWRLRWTQDGELNPADSVARNQYPTAYIIGTISLCCAVLACATLIGESTEERVYERNLKTDGAPSSQLFWLQPGNQVVANETFDAFAYVENVGKSPLLSYTTSSKRKVDHFHSYTWIAAILSLGGYIAQFVGLRGMHASVSIAQLGATLLMSVLRSCLRVRRLKRTDNKLADIPDIIVGHELDWLALLIAAGANSNPGPPLPGRSHIASNQGNICGWSVIAGHHNPAKGPLEIDPNIEARVGGGDASSGQHQEGIDMVEMALRYRTRLADLTRHRSLAPPDPRSIQGWSDERVLVRATAAQLAKALCSSADSLLGSHDRHKSITLAVYANAWRLVPDDGNVVTSPFNAGRPQPSCPMPLRAKTIELELERTEDASLTRWSIDSARLEGILGLWVWSLKHAEALQHNTRGGTISPIPQTVPIARIILAEDWEVDREVEHFRRMRHGLELWLGHGVVRLMQGRLDYPAGSDMLGVSEIWQSTDSKVWHLASSDDDGMIHDSPRFRHTRFFGWLWVDFTR